MTRDDPARFAALLIRLSAIQLDHFHKGALQVYLAVRPYSPEKLKNMQ